MTPVHAVRCSQLDDWCRLVERDEGNRELRGPIVAAKAYFYLGPLRGDREIAAALALCEKKGLMFAASRREENAAALDQLTAKVRSIILDAIAILRSGVSQNTSGRLDRRRHTSTCPTASNFDGYSFVTIFKFEKSIPDTRTSARHWSSNSTVSPAATSCCSTATISFTTWRICRYCHFFCRIHLVTIIAYWLMIATAPFAEIRIENAKRNFSEKEF